MEDDVYYDVYLPRHATWGAGGPPLRVEKAVQGYVVAGEVVSSACQRPPFADRRGNASGKKKSFLTEELFPHAPPYPRRAPNIYKRFRIREAFRPVKLFAVLEALLDRRRASCYAWPYAQEE